MKTSGLNFLLYGCSLKWHWALPLPVQSVRSETAPFCQVSGRQGSAPCHPHLQRGALPVREFRDFKSSPQLTSGECWTIRASSSLVLIRSWTLDKKKAWTPYLQSLTIYLRFKFCDLIDSWWETEMLMVNDSKQLPICGRAESFAVAEFAPPKGRRWDLGVWWQNLWSTKGRTQGRGVNTHHQRLQDVLWAR